MTNIAEDRFNAISEQGLCIGCGLCQSVAGKNDAGTDRIAMRVVKNGYERPVIQDALDDAIVDKIYDVCPAVTVDGLPKHQHASDSKLDNVWGVWRRMVMAYAGDEQTRFEGSTGGVLTALAIYLLKSKRVDFILHAKPGQQYPAFGERHLSFTADDVMQGVGSRYGPCATLLDIDDILARGQTFAFIGKPCDIGALRNYARHDERINAQVKYWLTLVCGGYSPPATTTQFLRDNDLPPETLTALRYRGQGCPGPTRITSGGETKDFNYIDFWGEDETQWELPFRCKICPDGIGESADIAAADSWLGGSPQRDVGGDIGTNAVIIRTEAGQELFEAALADGALAMDDDIMPDRLSMFQPHQVNKKYAAWARHQGLKDAGRISMTTENLRIKELADELPASVNQAQSAGTVARVKAGKSDEDVPKI